MSRPDILTRASTSRTRLGLAALALAAVLGVIAVGIALTHEQTKSQILTNFKARGAISAGFVSTYLSEQASRETLTAQRYLAGRQGFTTEFERLLASFGSEAGGLLDSSGRLLAIAPQEPAVLGTRAAANLSHIKAAEAGHVAVSGVFLSVARGNPVVAIAVPYPTPEGRRVFAVGYPVAGSVLGTFVEHSVATKAHLVLLIDANGAIIAASPRTAATTLLGRSPNLAKGVSRSSLGRVTIAGKPNTFVVTAVAGAPWRVVIAVPNAKLFASISGWPRWLPWIVFAMIALLAL